MTSLYYDEYGAGPPLVLLHGLFGSATNWRNIARSLSDRYRVLVPDARNHGRSPHNAQMTYPAMAQDIVDWLTILGIEQAVLVGHSMGGKTAMTLALTTPQMLTKLAVIDIAPVRYTHTHLSLIEAMRGLDLATLRSRGEADRALAENIPDPGIRGFLLQNLVLEEGSLRWRLNLAALAAHMDDLVGFPEFGETSYSQPVVFIAGSRSDYVLPEHEPRIYRYFPNAQIERVDAGHWIHVEQPERLLESLDNFISSSYV